MSAPTPASAIGDDGVLNRVRARTTFAGLTMMCATALFALTGWVWPAWLAGGPGLAIGVVVVAAAGGMGLMLLRRARLWGVAAVRASSWAGDLGGPGWVKAVCGQARPMRRNSGPPMLRRVSKHAQIVLPLRAQSGPLSAGEAVMVHARADALAPTRDDDLLVYAVTARGPILIGRPADGVLFVADRWTFAAL